jgi:hypothetical protein
LDKLFAYFNIRDLEERISLAPEPEIPVLQRRVVRLSMQTSIVSQFTALTATLEYQPERERQADQHLRARKSTALQSGVQKFTQAATGRQVREQCAWDQRMQGIQQIAKPAGQWGESVDSRQDHTLFECCRSFKRRSNVKQQESMRRLPPKHQPVPMVTQISDLRDIAGIISIQAFDGYWDASLPGFDCVPWKTFVQLQGISDHRELKLVQRTLYALAVLDKVGCDKRVLWSIVSEKAKEWLQSKLPLPEFDTLIVGLQQFIP